METSPHDKFEQLRSTLLKQEFKIKDEIRGMLEQETATEGTEAGIEQQLAQEQDETKKQTLEKQRWEIEDQRRLIKQERWNVEAGLHIVEQKLQMIKRWAYLQDQLKSSTSKESEVEGEVLQVQQQELQEEEPGMRRRIEESLKAAVAKEGEAEQKRQKLEQQEQEIEDPMQRREIERERWNLEDELHAIEKERWV